MVSIAPTCGLAPSLTLPKGPNFTLKTLNFGHDVPTKCLFRDGCDRHNVRTYSSSCAICSCLLLFLILLLNVPLLPLLFHHILLRLLHHILSPRLPTHSRNHGKPCWKSTIMLSEWPEKWFAYILQSGADRFLTIFSATKGKEVLHLLAAEQKSARD